ncbi:sulfite exporter TauE/SafE family protein [Rhizobium sp. 32-5/1]|uniref:sulfite exporter TauE/SafE family protein n=1 Tax=Rhizobium sp. 32-5/1 TaxID=3019602 RepID=UPI00240D42FF|nr:sulfite exporter TauE/SafE family protein [Rhizobium sp. 32-5/1]WEZ83257.1 sulfite exporter TauE/SafE family protein [Rhizobium sp. 32-5/1]
MSAAAIATLGSGGIVGFTLGLVGGGGSVLAVPLLLYVVGVASPHVAIGTSAVAVSVNAFANFAVHARAGHVWWRCAAVFAFFGTITAFGASTLGKAFDGQHLLFAFGLVMIVVGGWMLKPKKAIVSAVRPVDMRMCLTTALVASATGAASGFFGIGGGFLIVPALILATGMPMIQAVGSSLLAIGTFGLATALNYAVSGLIDWTVAAQFISGGILGGVGGTMLATRLAARKAVLNRIFALLVLLAALYVLYRSGWPF